MPLAVWLAVMTGTGLAAESVKGVTTSKVVPKRSSSSVMALATTARVCRFWSPGKEMPVTVELAVPKATPRGGFTQSLTASAATAAKSKRRTIRVGVFSARAAPVALVPLGTLGTLRITKN